MFQGIIGLLLECGHYQPKSGIERLNSLDARQAEGLVCGNSLQKCCDVVKPVLGVNAVGGGPEAHNNKEMYGLGFMVVNTATGRH